MTLNEEWLLVPDGMFCHFKCFAISKTADLLGFSCTIISSVYREWFEKEKYPVSGSYVNENALLMSEVRGEWTDWLEMIERPQ